MCCLGGDPVPQLAARPLPGEVKSSFVIIPLVTII